jgi:hypothetical protein
MVIPIRNCKQRYFKRRWICFISTWIKYFTAIYINDEPAYENIQGKWLTNKDSWWYTELPLAKAKWKGFAKLILKYVE